MSAEEILEAAHAAAKRGWRVIALHSVREDGSCTCNRADCSPGNHGKHPVDAGWQNTPAMSAADVQATWEAGDRNVGVATGAPSGFWVLDIDIDSGGMESARKLQADHGPLPTTVIAQTGGGGWHYLFAMPDFDVRNRQSSVLGQGIDVRGTGGQVVMPPSVSGKGAYRWAVAPEGVEIPRAPAWLEELLRPVESKDAVYSSDTPDRSAMSDAERRRLDRYTANIVARETDRLKECTTKAKPGGSGYAGPPWNATTFEVACTLLQLANSAWSEMTEAGVHDLVMQHAPRDRDFSDAVVTKAFESARTRIGSKARDLPVDRTPAAAVVPSGKVDPFEDPTGGAWAAGGAEPPQVAPAAAAGHTAPRNWAPRSWDDLGNAQRVVDHYGDRLRWIEQAKRWALYENGRWSMDEGQAGRSLIHQMIELLPTTEAMEYPEVADDDEPTRGDFVKFVKKQRMSARISAAIVEAAGRPQMQATINDFDHDPMLLNVANGVVNLETGELMAHSPNLLLMQQSPVAYDPAAVAPRWEKFLGEVLPNPDMRDYLQRIVGYSLTGKTGEQAMFIHHGQGANGKSVFLQVASELCGTYGQVVPRETLLSRSNGSSEHPTAIARMVGKRFLQASETAAGRRLDEEMVKGLTGGEMQPARFMGRDWFDFTPTGKIHFVTNHLPRLTDAESIWRRLHLVGWRVVIPKEYRDPELANRIIAEELPGVLAWAVRGALAWAQRGLGVPAAARLQLEDYRESQDVFGDFINECITRDPNAYEALPDLFGSYQAWCQRSGIRNVMMRNDFAQTLSDRPGFERHRKSSSRGFLGGSINPYGRPPLPGHQPASLTHDPGVKFDPFEDR